MLRVIAILLSQVSLVVVFGLVDGSAATRAAELGPHLAKIRGVGKDGQGHPAAMAAYREVVRADAVQIPEILAGFAGAGPLAENWLRAAVDTIAERQLNGGQPLPQAELEAFVRDPAGPPAARSLAFEWLCRVAPSVREPLLQTMLDDPSAELRRSAVQLAIDNAGRIDKEKERERAIGEYRRALSAARDLDQVDLVAERLRDLGQSVDLPRHFGLVLNWRVMGPFDNTDRAGFQQVFPPEKQLNEGDTCQGSLGEVRWRPYVSSDRLGIVDLNAPLGERKQVTGYAWTRLRVPQPQEVEFRWTTRNASKIWLNGDLIAEQEVYHSGGSFDQYRVRATLRKGDNEVLVKVCQNEQTQPWTKEWGFQFRVCDEQGAAIPIEENKDNQ